MRLSRLLFLCAMINLFHHIAVSENGEHVPWNRHTIDNTSEGADGIRLADANRDGLLDIATGWEEGGVIRVYLNPGPDLVKKPWPQVTVGEVASPEDAVFADLDDDGAMDVISCCEGKTQQVNIHWAPNNPQLYLNSNTWKTEFFPLTKNKTRWMFCLPIQVDGKNGIDLVLGSKNDNGLVGWLESPKNPRNLKDWRWHPLEKANWIMNIEAHDLNQDGRQDLLISDRKGDTRQCYWLEHPGYEKSKGQWPRHPITGNDHEFMFLDFADVNGDDLPDLPVAISSKSFLIYFAKSRLPQLWEKVEIPFPPNTGRGKSVRVGDINMDKTPDIVVSCEHADNNQCGVFWMEHIGNTWQSHPISGPEGIKFDLLQLIDLDKDGDLDVLTCEERDNLGAVWYENPSL